RTEAATCYIKQADGPNYNYDYRPFNARALVGLARGQHDAPRVLGCNPLFRRRGPRVLGLALAVPLGDADLPLHAPVCDSALAGAVVAAAGTAPTLDLAGRDLVVRARAQRAARRHAGLLPLPLSHQRRRPE